MRPSSSSSSARPTPSSSPSHHHPSRPLCSRRRIVFFDPPPPHYVRVANSRGGARDPFVSSLDSIEPILRLRKTTRKSTENSPSTRKSNAVSSAVYSQVLTNYDHADEEKCSRSRKRRHDDDNVGGAGGGDILDGVSWEEGRISKAMRSTEEDDEGGEDGGEEGARVDPPARERPAVSSGCGTTRFRVVLLLLLNLSIILLPALIVTLTLARTLISDEKNIGNPISYGISG